MLHMYLDKVVKGRRPSWRQSGGDAAVAVTALGQVSRLGELEARARISALRPTTSRKTTETRGILGCGRVDALLGSQALHLLESGKATQGAPVVATAAAAAVIRRVLVAFPPRMPPPASAGVVTVGSRLVAVAVGRHVFMSMSSPVPLLTHEKERSRSDEHEYEQTKRDIYISRLDAKDRIVSCAWGFARRFQRTRIGGSR